MATFRATVNPIKAGGSESMHRKRPLLIGIGLKCIFLDQFFKVSSLKKIRLITLTVWELEKGEKSQK